MIDLWRNLYARLSRKVLRRPGGMHFEPSVICSPDGTGPSDYLIELALKAIGIAHHEHINIEATAPADARYFNIFPGEHYRLLKAIIKGTNPARVVEIGTFTGMGSFAMKQGLSAGRLTTFDIVPWESFDTHLTRKDFDSGMVTQILSDLSNGSEFEKYLSLLDEADIIFLDAPKDGRFEYQMMDKFRRLSPRTGRLLVLDDIRFVNMVELWRGIRSPKLDITSFGHWSGTGLVDLSQPLEFIAIEH